MIKIDDKQQCCGCGACAAGCPAGCIAMCEDAEGFLYPVADAATCIDCGLCERVCPFVAGESRPRGEQSLLLVNDDAAVREASSSGGAFTLLARAVLAHGGSVWGAALDGQHNVQHVEATDEAGLARLRGSKYVESRQGDVYRRVRTQLAAGREVLYSGTPCQVAGLRRYLRRDYDNLLLVEVACHGVAPQALWQQSLREWCGERGFTPHDIVGIDFRDKVQGWEHYSFTVTTARGRHTRRLTPYLRGYAANLFLRPSCYKCAVKAAGSYADVTLADAWGVQEVTCEAPYGDDRGVSLVIPNTEAGRRAVESLTGCHMLAVDTRPMLERNPGMVHSAPLTTGRARFYEHYHAGNSVAASVAVGDPMTPMRCAEKILTPLLKALGIKGFTKRWRQRKK